MLQNSLLRELTTSGMRTSAEKMASPVKFSPNVWKNILVNRRVRAASAARITAVSSVHVCELVICIKEARVGGAACSTYVASRAGTAKK